MRSTFIRARINANKNAHFPATYMLTLCFPPVNPWMLSRIRYLCTSIVLTSFKIHSATFKIIDGIMHKMHVTFLGKMS